MPNGSRSICHIPSDFVVDQWASDGESSSHRDFLFQQVVMKWTRPLCGPASMSQNDFKTSETMQPQEASPVKHHISVLGIDIAKRVFHVVGMDERGQIVLRKRLSRHD